MKCPCPVCNQDYLIYVYVEKLGLEGFICPECEAFFVGNSLEKLDFEGNGKAFHIRMRERGFPETWDEIRIL